MKELTINEIITLSANILHEIESILIFFLAFIVFIVIFKAVWNFIFKSKKEMKIKKILKNLHKDDTIIFLSFDKNGIPSYIKRNDEIIKI